MVVLPEGYQILKEDVEILPSDRVVGFKDDSCYVLPDDQIGKTPLDLKSKVIIRPIHKPNAEHPQDVIVDGDVRINPDWIEEMTDYQNSMLGCGEYKLEDGHIVKMG